MNKSKIEEKIKFGWESLLTIFFQVALSSQETFFYLFPAAKKLYYNDNSGNLARSASKNIARIFQKHCKLLCYINIYGHMAEYVSKNISRLFQKYCKILCYIDSCGHMAEYVSKNVAKIFDQSCKIFQDVAKILQQYFKNIAKILRYIHTSGHLAEYASYAKNEDNEVTVSAAHDHTQSVFHHRSLSFPLFLSL